MPEFRHLVGSRIRAIRKAKGLTQQNLAERSNLDDAYIGAVERGERNFSIDTLEKVLKALEISPVELFRSTNDLDDEKQAHRRALDEFIANTSDLSTDQIDIVTKINREIIRAFRLD
ncbi:hypothetical protein BRE01_22080 [Brevibacillus reuszeri]|uniref:Transcriptional regulator n=1 Tax=Brevibacillus reuszeri TaxID=54915 RepID=A0A0K9YWT8_9BACL|nr:helix-turn-helix transcriptional regulator [Brevibacillus reuszeri]KNB73153.1 transcriptional regulator [Brevibacillus reuszeri]MED1856747.1 helix-turn-helix transcriptional regulator [Brevibacillus reuszeri]GED68506.1 hypothetical protein BRE01_22080 [Brevibacillus reuszeri]